MSNATKERLVRSSDYMDYDWVKPKFQGYEKQKSERMRGRRLMRAAVHARDFQLPEEQLTNQIREIKSRISQDEADDILEAA